MHFEVFFWIVGSGTSVEVKPFLRALRSVPLGLKGAGLRSYTSMPFARPAGTDTTVRSQVAADVSPAARPPVIAKYTDEVMRQATRNTHPRNQAS